VSTRHLFSQSTVNSYLIAMLIYILSLSVMIVVHVVILPLLQLQLL